MARLKLLIYVLPALLSLQTLATRRRASQALFVSVHQGVLCEWWIIVCVINRKVKCVCVDHLGSVSNRLWRNSHTGQPGMITVQKDRSLLLYTNQACNYVTFTEGDVYRAAFPWLVTQYISSQKRVRLYWQGHLSSPKSYLSCYTWLLGCRVLTDQCNTDLKQGENSVRRKVEAAQ